MGLFDSFKKKAKKNARALNPLFTALDKANFGIHDMQVVNEQGHATVSGIIDDGAILEKVNAFLEAQPGVQSISNNIEISDISAQGKKCKGATKGSNLNVRAGASTTDDVVGRFSPNAEILLVRRYNSTWHQVRGVGIKGKEIEGYSHTDYLHAL